MSWLLYIWGIVDHLIDGEDCRSSSTFPPGGGESSIILSSYKNFPPRGVKLNYASIFLHGILLIKRTYTPVLGPTLALACLKCVGWDERISFRWDLGLWSPCGGTESQILSGRVGPVVVQRVFKAVGREELVYLGNIIRLRRKSGGSV